MKKAKSNAPLIIVLLILVVLAAGLLAVMIQFAASHFFVGGRAYAYGTQYLDLRGQSVTAEELDAIQAQLPDCTIRRDIAFQGGSYSDDTRHLTVTTLSATDLDLLSQFESLQSVDATGCGDPQQIQALLEAFPQLQVDYNVAINGQVYPWDTETLVCQELTDEDIARMGMLPRLTTVDASQCRDYGQIGKLAAAYPHVAVSYNVEMMGTIFTEADTAATFQDPNVEELLEKLAWLPHMESVHLVEPSASPDALRQLLEAYPDVAITWDKTVLGKTFSSTQTEFDFSGRKFDSTDPVEEAMAYFPYAEKVIMSNCGIDNETMAAFREKMRPSYKVVWTVYITKKPVRTDQEVIHSSAMKVCLIDEQSFDLKYCEDAIVVDIGHSYVKDISWVKGMPKLKYLILAHNWIKDLTPISTCKNLVYLEIFWNKHIPDYTPLQGCTSLVDLNISGSYADLDPLKEMTWLENLWANCRGMTQGEYEELQEALPNTRIEYRGGDHTTLGWRELQSYFDMRDIMGLPYNSW